MDPKLSLSWEAYQKNLCQGLSLLQQRGEFVDMTLAADGYHVKVHQMVMSLVSPFIKDLIKSANCPHPVIFLNRVSYQTLLSILEYAYTGEVLVARDVLYEFLDACKVLHIKGLEHETLKTTADSAMLRLIGNLTEPGPKAPSPAPIYQQTSDFKRRKTDDVHVEEPIETETITDDYRDDSNIQEDALDDYELDETEDKVKNDNEKYEIAKQKQDKAGTVVQYSLSCQGSIQVILNRFIYRIRYSRKNNEKMYRCAEYNKKACPAFVVTKGDIVIERGCSHNHPFHDRQILKRIRNGNVYTQYNTAESVATLSKKAPRDARVVLPDESEED